MRERQQRGASDGTGSLDSIKDPAGLLRQCAQVFTKDLQFPKVGFTSQPLARQTTRYTLRGENQSLGFARETYPIHLFCESMDSLYWLAVVMDIRYRNPLHELTNVQLIIFRGSAYGPKDPYIRAEWHCSEEFMSERHAQPHWHVYIPGNGPERQQQFGQAKVQQFGVAMKEAAGKDSELLPFHFAMAANWHGGSLTGHVERLVDTNGLTNWVRGCVSYMRGQLQNS